MKTLSFAIKPIQIDYKINDNIEHATVAEYYIGGKPLADILHIKRDLQFADTAFNMLFPLPENGISVQTQASIEESIKQFVGEIAPMNQFNSQRLVLYRCHCGSDYCGIISCAVHFTDTTVTWSDIAFEIDDTIVQLYKEYNIDLSHVDTFVFDRVQYNNTFSQLKKVVA